MRIAYLLDRDPLDRSGVSEKILGQVRRWSVLGHETVLLDPLRGVVHDPDALDGSQQFDDVRPERAARSRPVASASALLQRYRRSRALIRQANPELVVMREPLGLPGWRGLFDRPAIVEINTGPGEWSLRHPLARRLHDRTVRDVFTRASGIVALSHEIHAQYDLASIGVPSIVLANGCVVPPRPMAHAGTDVAPTLCLVGSPGQSWHGVDRLARLARAWPDCRIDVVGPAASEVGGDVPSNMRFHGVRSHEEAQSILGGAHVGVSTLCLYRKRMEEASSLKTRQYLAAGRPVVLAYRDTDLVGLAGTVATDPFVLTLPNAEALSDDDVARIRRFVEEARASPDVGVAAHEFAREHLDLSAKERTRLAFFESVLDGSAAAVDSTRAAPQAGGAEAPRGVGRDRR